MKQNVIYYTAYIYICVCVEKKREWNVQQRHNIHSAFRAVQSNVDNYFRIVFAFSIMSFCSCSNLLLPSFLQVVINLVFQKLGKYLRGGGGKKKLRWWCYATTRQSDINNECEFSITSQLPYKDWFCTHFIQLMIGTFFALFTAATTAPCTVSVVRFICLDIFDLINGIYTIEKTITNEPMC